jgi:hypothetical protein
METFQVESEPDVRQLHHDVIQDGGGCLACHTEHRGALTPITIRRLGNPHGELIFRATGATSCSDCHMMESVAEENGGTLFRNAWVDQLIRKGEGAHRSGHFAKCLKCHRGGQLEAEEEKDEDAVKEDD